MQQMYMQQMAQDSPRTNAFKQQLNLQQQNQLQYQPQQDHFQRNSRRQLQNQTMPPQYQQ